MECGETSLITAKGKGIRRIFHPMQFDALFTSRFILRKLDGLAYAYWLREVPDEVALKELGLANAEALALERTRLDTGFESFNRKLLLFQIIEKERHEVLGWCGFHTWYIQHHRAELGYVIHDTRNHNAGIMSEVLPEVIRYGFTTMKLHRIEAMVGPNNGASLRLMQKFGFREEGHLKAHYLRNGIYEDSVVFGLLRSEWDSGLGLATS